VDKNPGCRVCEYKYYRSLQGGSGLCKECPEMSIWVWIFGAMALMALCPLLLKVWR